MLNSITFIHLENYMFHDIKANIISLMNLSCSLINLSRSLMNYTSVKLAKTTDWLLNLISIKLWLELNHQSCTSKDEMLSLFIIIYIARIMIIYSSLKHTRHYHLYLSNCLALFVVNKESYRSILRFVINHASSSLIWWIDSMRSFWLHFSISSWLHMSKSCKNVFFIFLM